MRISTWDGNRVRRATALLGVACLALISALWRWHVELAIPPAFSMLASVRAKVAADPAVAPPPRAADYATRLPRDAGVDAIVSELQHSSEKAGVAFVSVSVTRRAATGDHLGRADIAVVLRGAYPQLKAVLGDCLDRFPNLVLQRLELRRQSAPVDIEARLSLVAVSRPDAVRQLDASNASQGASAPR